MTNEPNPGLTSSEAVTEKPAAIPVVANTTGIEPSPPSPALTSQPPIVAPAKPFLPATDWIILALLLILSFFLASFEATNSDAYMNLAIGKRISDGAFTRGADPFSWATEATETRPAPYWVHHGWLFSWLFYQLYSLGFVGGAGLVVIKAIVFTATIVVLSRIGWKTGNRWFVLICLTMVALAISPRVLLQPTVVSFGLLAVTMLLLFRGGLLGSWQPDSDEGKPCLGCLWYLPPLMALWANLDAWFILGPLVIGMAWAGVGVEKWLAGSSRVCGKTVGLVFGASVLACLLNPYHVRVFQLPPELAYIALSLKLPLPDAIAGAGRTWQMMKQVEPGLPDPSLPYTMSPLSRLYFQPSFGLNIAAIAFYPLVILGIASFVMIAVTRTTPGAPKLHYGRFLIWLFFAVMALAMYRMIPYFVLVAGPITALTLSEFLAWQQLQAGPVEGGQDRGLHLARFVTVPFMLLLLYLAWPGWLHGPFDFYSYGTRRVAWGMQPDGSMRAAAEKLKSLKAKGECGNVFNIDARFPDYCAWYAPEVKCFIDTRHALFPDQMGAYLKAKQALLTPGRPEEDWQDLFKKRGIDQVVLGAFANLAKLRAWLTKETWIRFEMQRQQDPTSESALAALERTVPLRWWVHADQWRERYGDNRVMVFSWAGLRTPPQWPANTSRDDWNRQAFGDVPLERRPPIEGSRQPEQLGLINLYTHGVGPHPHQAMESLLLGVQFQTQNHLDSQLRWFRLTFAGALVNMRALPGGALAFAPCLDASVTTLMINKSADFGPPALPILMARSARQAVAENPHDHVAQLSLLEAYDQLHRFQENYWAHQFAEPNMREDLRKYQRITAAFNLAQLQPDDFNYQYRLGQEYLRTSQIDLAVHHMQLAGQKLEQRPDAPPAMLKNLQDEIKVIDRSLQLRQARLKEQSLGKNALELAEYAALGRFKEESGGQAVESRLGLTKKALEILAGIDHLALGDTERVRLLQLNLELLLEMGRAGEAVDILKSDYANKKISGFKYAQNQVLMLGILGDYKSMDKGLEELEKTYLGRAQLTGGIRVGSIFTLPAMTPAPLAISLALQVPAPGARAVWLPHRWQPFQQEYNILFNIRTLRGIVALESGDTKKARDIFAAVIRDKHEDFHFADYPIARRYLELLNEQQK